MSRPRVLLVEDHPLIQDVIRKVLEAEFDIVGAVERSDAVLPAAQELFADAVVLDISLPDGSGMQVLAELRAALPGVGIVMLTTRIDPVYQEEALARGADAFVGKSRAVTDLLPALRAVLTPKRTWKGAGPENCAPNRKLSRP